MNESRWAVKVGLFVLIGLVLMAALLVKFSKSGALFTPTYTIELVTRNVAGLKPGASVLMAACRWAMSKRLIWPRTAAWSSFS